MQSTAALLIARHRGRYRRHRHTNEILEQRSPSAPPSSKAPIAGSRADRGARRRKRSSRQAQRIDAIGQLTAASPHDFNNLLTSIIGNIELVEARLEPHERARRPAAGAALAAAGRGANLTAASSRFAAAADASGGARSQSGHRRRGAAAAQPRIGATIHIDIVRARMCGPRSPTRPRSSLCC